MSYDITNTQVDDESDVFHPLLRLMEG
jgi:hypothetical protein